MKIIGIVESDDYSGAAIIDFAYLSLVHTNGCWLAASKCMFSNMPVTCEISEEQAVKFIQKGVQCIDLDDTIKIDEKISKPKKKKK
jgi:hypothetical protein